MYEDWLSKKYTRGSYFCYDTESNIKDKIRAFRFPGATRGHVCLDKNNVIKGFVVYKNGENIDCYKVDLESALNDKYNGVKLIFKK